MHGVHVLPTDRVNFLRAFFSEPHNVMVIFFVCKKYLSLRRTVYVIIVLCVVLIPRLCEGQVRLPNQTSDTSCLQKKRENDHHKQKILA